MMGGSVKGGDVYGDYPLMKSNNDPTDTLNLGRGRLIPTMSVDEMAAELSMWFGVDNNQSLEDILPNIRTFYDSSETNPPLNMFT